MNKFTKGPWSVEGFETIAQAKEEGYFEWCCLEDFDGDPVGCVWQRTERGGLTGLPGCIETSLANAHLIAAAPAMYEALREVQDSKQVGIMDYRVQDLIAEAIALAEGRE